MKKVVHFMGFVPFNCRAGISTFLNKKYAVYWNNANKALNEKNLYKKAVKEAWEWEEEKTGSGHKRNLPSLQIFAMKSFQKQAAFSLVELLMALLVASLLMAALAPVMTRRFGENVNVTGNMNPAGTTKTIHIIDYDSTECDEIKTDVDGSTYCEGEFMVPAGYNGIIKATVIGAGGGGGTAPTAGYTEYTTVSSNHQFTVPAMVNKAEATLVSGGAGGGAGGTVKILKEFTTVGSNTFNVPDALKNRYALVDICGAGGSGGLASMNSCWGSSIQYQGTGGGGSGGYYQNKYVRFPGDETVQVYVGAAGGMPQYFWDSVMYSTTRVDFSKGNGANVEDASGGAGGGTSNPRVQGRIGGKGGHSVGAKGGAYVGDCGLVGGGGGGGGASRLCTSGQSCYLYVGGGGGGGGEPIRMMNSSGIQATLSGGGGGGGGGTGLGGNGGSSSEMDYGCVAGGGGGGRPGGNNGGQSGCNNANPATSGAGGNSPLSKYPNKCAGGHGEGYNNTFNARKYTDSANWNKTNPRPPKDGIVAITYLDYGPGGSGGGGAHIVPIQEINVIPKETLNVKVGSGGIGGAVGIINSDSTITNPGIGQGSNTNVTQMVTQISRGSTAILTTPNNAGKGLYGGSPTGQILGASISPYYGAVGWITNGQPNLFTTLTSLGFSNTTGKTANNTTSIGSNVYPNASIGGDGGIVTTPFTGTCAPGRGGTKTSINGTDASGHGCGGGGGYAFGHGGNGGGGYARISWNKYWDGASNSYKLANVGAAGGGASGNAFTYSVAVKSNEIIKVRIGKGGAGAYVSNNSVINSKKGGDSAFGDIKAGGGYGGNSPSINSSNVLANGAGGDISNICHFKSTSYFNKASYCKKGLKGVDAVDVKGGAGANFTPLTYDEEKTVSGTGGTGGQIDTGDNANGKAAGGFASGGGGASIRDLGRVDSSSQSNITNNQTKGGDGANGKIILEWWR